MAQYGNPYTQIKLAPAPTATKSGVAEIIARGGRDLASIAMQGFANYEKKNQDQANAKALQARAAGEDSFQTQLDEDDTRKALTLDEDGNTVLTKTTESMINRGDEVAKKATIARDELLAKTTKEIGPLMDDASIENTVLNMRTRGDSEDNISGFVQGEQLKRQAQQQATEAIGSQPLENFGDLSNLEKARLKRSERAKVRVASDAETIEATRQAGVTAGTNMSKADAQAQYKKVLSGADAATMEKIGNLDREDARTKVLDDRYAVSQQQFKDKTIYEQGRDTAKDKKDDLKIKLDAQIRSENIAFKEKEAGFRREHEKAMEGLSRQARNLAQQTYNDGVTERKRVHAEKKATAKAVYTQATRDTTIVDDPTVEKWVRNLSDTEQVAIGGKFDALVAKQKTEKENSTFNTPKSDEELAAEYLSEHGSTTDGTDSAIVQFGKWFAKSPLSGKTKEEIAAMSVTDIMGETNTLGSVIKGIFASGDSEQVKATKAKNLIIKNRDALAEKATKDKKLKKYISDYKKEETTFNEAQKAEKQAFYDEIQGGDQYTKEVVIPGEVRQMTSSENVAALQASMSNPKTFEGMTDIRKEAQKIAIGQDIIKHKTAMASQNVAAKKAMADQVKQMQKAQLEKELVILKGAIAKKENIQKNELKMRAIKAEIAARKAAGQWSDN